MRGHELKAAAAAVGFGTEVSLAYLCGKLKLLMGTVCGLAIGGKILFPLLKDSKKFATKSCEHSDRHCSFADPSGGHEGNARLGISSRAPAKNTRR